MEGESKESDGGWCYWASCASGLQSVLINDTNILNSTAVVLDSSIFGGVVFSTSSPPRDVVQLRSADNLYAYIGHFQDVPTEKESAMLFFKGLAAKIDWEPAIKLYKAWQTSVVNVCPRFASDCLNATNFSPSFRVSCDRSCMKMKKHGFTSNEAAAALGEGIHTLFGWPGDMRSYDLEVLLWIRDAEALLAVGLIYSGNGRGLDRSLPFLKSKLPQTEDPLNEMELVLLPHFERTSRSTRPSRAEAQLYSWRKFRQALVDTSLKPSTAYALLQLGRISPGNIVVDPMCGCGTIPLEAADWLDGKVMCLGGDISSKAVDAGYENTTKGMVGHCDIVKWDASNLPLREGCVDRIVCDMPFGNRCGSHRARESLCPKVVKEVIRVLRPGTGVAVLMAQGKTIKEELTVRQSDFVQMLDHVPIEMAGLRVDAYVVMRTTEPFIDKVMTGNAKRSKLEC